MTDELNKLSIDKNSFVVVGSGVIVQLGLKEFTDIDLVVTRNVFKKLAKDPSWQTGSFTNGEKYLMQGDVELMLSWDSASGKPNFDDLVEDSVSIDGYQFAKPERVYEWKLKMNRPKDKRDIKTLKRYIDRHKQ
jgi:hypothetical protein